MVYARNKKASFDYFLETRYEAGIELVGTEVKSIKLGKVSIKESFVRIIKNEVFILNMNVTGYEYGNIHNIDEKISRKLILNKKEIEKLKEKTSIKGYTIVPVSIYSKNRLVKVEIALAKGKKNYDKRESLKEKTIKREIEREHRN